MKKAILYFLLGLILFGSYSCRRINEHNQNPELVPLKHGFQVCNAIAYCTSVAHSVFKKGVIPPNVVLVSSQAGDESNGAILYIDISPYYPLPFNHNVGQIILSVLWSGNGGVMSAAYTNINILEKQYNFLGLLTIPFMEREEGKYLTVFAEQDIVIGSDDDTLIHINLMAGQFEMELDRLNNIQPTNTNAAVQQNVWFVNVNTRNTNTVYDDELTINGGGQIAMVESATGGVLYHAMIGVKSCYDICPLNPYEGVGFIQNMMVGDNTDLGTIVLSFPSECHGTAFVEAATGKYLGSNRSWIDIGFY
ncbi:MAG: hypothetical protein JXR53_03275 [Bacteroidales bacterium]|nr:hypothetical protein [Bacteroidales bacterium]